MIQIGLAMESGADCDGHASLAPNAPGVAASSPFGMSPDIAAGAAGPSRLSPPVESAGADAAAIVGDHALPAVPTKPPPMTWPLPMSQALTCPVAELRHRMSVVPSAL